MMWCSKFSASEVKSLRKVFMEMDINNSGTIDHEVMLHLNPDLLHPILNICVRE